MASFDREVQVSTTLGTPLPHYDNHSVSVSLPLWDHVIGYEEGDHKVIGRMVTGYPRFRFHNLIQGLQVLFSAFYQWNTTDISNEPDVVIQVFGEEGFTIDSRLRRIVPKEEKYQVLIFPSLAVARRFELFMNHPNSSEEGMEAHHVQLFQITNTSKVVAVYDKSGFVKAKKFWQHSGEILTSRQAEQLLSTLLTNPAIDIVTSRTDPSLPINSLDLFSNLPGLAPKGLMIGIRFSATALLWTPVPAVTETPDLYQLDQDYDESILLTIQQRICAVLNHNTNPPHVSPEHILITPTGMSAIFSAFRLVHHCYTHATNGLVPHFVVFGYPYLDTLKVMMRPEWNQGGVHFFGQGDCNDLHQLEMYLEENALPQGTHSPFHNRIAAIFAEFPTNPLLKCSNLERLTGLARRFGVLLVVDDTIGNYANINVISHPEVSADLLVTSLTKIWNGASNTMAGGLIVNPHLPSDRYELLNTQFQQWKAENNFPLLPKYDAKVLEYNSRSFLVRSHIANINGVALAKWLSQHPAIAKTFHPSLNGHNVEYDRVKRPAIPFSVVQATFTEPDELYLDLMAKKSELQQVSAHEAGYGCLLSFELKPEVDVVRFHDAIDLNKGPSLGTNFTLVSPYTLLAHYYELDWAKQYGVSDRLLRVSIGLEDTEELIAKFNAAIEFALKKH